MSASRTFALLAIALVGGAVAALFTEPLLALLVILWRACAQ